MAPAHNDTSKYNRVTWSEHAQQRITYGDGDDTIDISKTLTSVKKRFVNRFNGQK